MQLTRFRDVSAFREIAERYLVEHEAEHNLILGITTGVVQDVVRPEQLPYLAVVQESGNVVAAAMQTPPHKLIISRAPLDPIRQIVGDIRLVRRTLPGVLGPRDAARAFAESWRQISQQPYRPGIAQRIYQLETVTPVQGVPGELVRATGVDWEMIVEWFKAFDTEAYGGESSTEEVERIAKAMFQSTTRGLYFWFDGQPVSMAGYSGPTPNGIRIGRVYTPPHLRGRGYASACVAALSQHLLDSGHRYCFLFTDLSNPTSNHIYQRIGYRPVADVSEYVFLAPTTP